MLTIATIDQQIAEQGSFCLIDWLLIHNHLSYTDYESWRYGKIESLVEKISLDEGALMALIADTSQHCAALGLSAEPKPLYQWGVSQSISLVASSTSGQSQQLIQHWLRPQDVPQLDLFMDNSSTIAENTTRDALNNRQFELAQEQLKKLIELNPTHSRLGSYQDLVNYGLHMQQNRQISGESLSVELAALQQEVMPLAQEVLSAAARDYLALAWRRLAHNLEGRRFTSQHPELHVSFALAQIPDWPGVIQSLKGTADLYENTFLMKIYATANTRLNNEGDALLAWCFMLDRDVEYTVTEIEQQKGRSIYQLWEAFEAFGDTAPDDYFAAFIVASQPGIIHLLDDHPSFAQQATREMINLLGCHLEGQNEIAAREALQDISPVLLNIYLQLQSTE